MKISRICARTYLDAPPLALTDLENGRTPARARQPWARTPSAAHLEYKLEFTKKLVTHFTEDDVERSFWLG